MEKFEKLLVEEIKDLHHAESQLVKALPKMAKAASNPKLKQGFEKHLKETEGHVKRLEQAAEKLGASPRGKACAAMKGLIEEGSEMMEEELPAEVKDAGLIAAAQKVEHYEIASYGSARALAEVLGHSEVAKLLQQTLDEETATDAALTTVAEAIYTASTKKAA